MTDTHRIPDMQPSPTSRGVFATRKRRAMSVATVLFLAIVLLIGVQSWKIVNAIVDVERSSVVPLPPSSRPVDLPGVPSASNQNAFDPDVASVQVVDQPSSASAIRLEPSIPGISFGASGSDQDQRENPQHEEPPAEPSRLEVAQQLVSAGMADGDPGASTVWDGKTSLTILVLGVDRREDGGDQNADVIIIARLDLIDKTLQGVSIPRDLLVDIPTVGPDKINSSYNHGVTVDPDDPVAGVALVRDTVESIFGVPIDDYVLLDFEGFEQVVDALGGVTVDVPYEIVDTEYPTTDYGMETVIFARGVQTLDGEQALKYVRTRHADGDDARRSRQIDVIVAALNSGQSISSLARADQLILAAGDAVQTSFTLEEQLTLARLASSLSEDDIDIVSVTEPLIQSGWTQDGRWVYLGNADEIAKFVLNALAESSTR